MSDMIFLNIEPRYIDLLTRIIEAYDHLGIVSTLDRRKGLVVIRGTEDTCQELHAILPTLPFKVNLLPDQEQYGPK